ncbi:MAG: threonine synthase [Candidatus Omnitrophica bacterium]|nr:threonine synthase [Candidatus Omnitrophota bacterium]MBD3269596.1 threonine synthase [Candidatus Omnitrophota bacterium]
MALVEDYKGVIKRYKRYLPVSRKTPVVTLQEGNTPLVYSPKISGRLGKNCRVYLKYEGLNPTGSFKDRGMTLAISKAAENKAKAVICASTGNTSASAAAYSHRANLKCIVLIPEGAIALGKLAQALIHKALVIAIRGNFDDALRLVREISLNYPVEVVNSINPYRIEGQKTASFEVCDSLKKPPDFHSLPVGNAGNITAYWKGYKEYFSYKKIYSLPCMLGFQAKGASPIVKGRPVEKPKTLATAIRIGNPASWEKAVEAKHESGGLIESVTDAQILSAYKFLACEGVFVEPASAASVAGLFKLAKEGFFEKKKSKEIIIVCTLTGHGLKDPQIAVKSIKPPLIVDADLRKILKIAKI